MTNDDKEYTPNPADDNANDDVASSDTPTPDTITPDNGGDGDDKHVTFSDPGFDMNEVTRKLNAMSEELGLLHKAISQLMTSAPASPSTGEATDSTRPNPHENVKTIDDLDL